uniref:SEFIR domain-containing protein n=1 Tax=Heliothis virescens TaxID=7102 RepID=A0A2A4JP75_HELVI
MLFAVYLVFLLFQTWAESARVGYRCSDDRSLDPKMTFTPSVPQVRGRYTVELCKLKDGEWTEWQIDVNYNKSNKTCEASNSMRKPGPQHSISTLDLRSINLPNCTHVCLSTDFDLIFKSCYQVKSILKVGSDSESPDDFFFIVGSNITRENVFAADAKVVFVNHDEYVTLDWILSIPPVDYSVIIQRYNNDTKELWDLQDVTRNCSVLDARSLYCTLAPEYGCYQAKLEHGGSWTSGTFHDLKFVTFMFCHKMVSPPQLEAHSSLALWLGGGAVLLALALLAGLLVFRRIDYKELMDGIIKLWPTAAPAPVAGPGGGDVLLVYAREGEAGQPVIDALKDLVRAATGARVVNSEIVYIIPCAPSLQVMSASELRALLCSRGNRAGASYILTLKFSYCNCDLTIPPLVVQSTPAIDLLRKPLRDHDAGPKLAAPLLGRRCVYRVPQFGDALVASLLSIIAENPRMHNDYHKLFLATIHGLETDVLPTVVPFTRYRLPDMAGTLGAALAGARAAALCDALQPQLRALAEAVAAFQHHARENPDYLMDELLVL